mmetsp:Transcript_15169/g.21638  ORF Transcript_15169/g.21638 Transcript_15169/m.21638 type:complete len:90 (+) Transcript_15169:29-298(+)|eukprot:CAMPEP_0184869078 /NCGR_PEP_ID=MMETSP0580-20130426/32755_1 /TAXON_ID=1118495 /ORGANISM="Dactyliosolen fragilissimus" /LENGTH=89 /DNA_ID=CAMNT_0027370319 /DNA_START=1 /DNA_END=270 /DNA_ORIENTATION=-
MLISREVVWLKKMFYQKEETLPEFSVTGDEVNEDTFLSDNDAEKSVKNETFVGENKGDDTEEESDDNIEGEALEENEEKTGKLRKVYHT